jgi:hypothetical protein
LTRPTADCSFRFLVNREPGATEQTLDGQQQVQAAHCQFIGKVHRLQCRLELSVRNYSDVVEGLFRQRREPIRSGSWIGKRIEQRPLEAESMLVPQPPNNPEFARLNWPTSLI